MTSIPVTTPPKGVLALLAVFTQVRLNTEFIRQNMTIVSTPAMGVIALLAAFTYVWLETEFYQTGHNQHSCYLTPPMGVIALKAAFTYIGQRHSHRSFSSSGLIQLSLARDIKFIRQSMTNVLVTTSLMGVLALLAAFTFVWLETDFYWTDHV